MSNIVNFADKKELSALYQTIRVKLKSAKDAIGQARADLLDIGDAFLEARVLLPENREFGSWCREFDDTLSRQEIYSLMTLAANRDTVIIIGQHMAYRGSNPERWHQAVAAFASEFGINLLKPADTAVPIPLTDMSVNAEPAPTSEPEAPPVEPKTQESTPEPIPESRKADHADLPEKLDVRMLLAKKLKEADALVLLNHYTNQKTRRTLGRMGKNQLLALVEKIRSGKFGVVNKGVFEKKFSARVLVPELPKEWTRGRSFEPIENGQINALLADSDRFLAMRDAGCKTMEQCNRWWIDNVLHRKAVDVTINPPRASTQTSESADEILVHGKVVWPPASFISHPEDYPRDLAVTCFHLWQDLDRQLKVSEPSPLGRGRFIALLATYLSEINKAAGDLLRQMAFAQQQDISGNLETSRLTRLSGDYNGF